MMKMIKWEQLFFNAICFIYLRYVLITALCLAAPTARRPLKLGQKTQRMMVPSRENMSLVYRLPSLSQLSSVFMLLKMFAIMLLSKRFTAHKNLRQKLTASPKKAPNVWIKIDPPTSTTPRTK